MDQGEVFEWQKLLRFNGHFFRDAEVLPLRREDLVVLLEAAEANWQYVEPSIFGTLLTRALDPRERHRLGAEYTPREYVERVVRQTVDVPLRERWAPVQAHAAELAASKRKKDRDAALGELRDFHAWMRRLRFLDPACGSGNFLYVTLHMVKRLELEVLRAIEEITGNPELGLDEVGPSQFHGIEIKPWAREIAELTLWIGYHQFWMEHHKGGKVPEPVLEDTGTLELRDAMLAYDDKVEIPEKSRLDPTLRIVHPVTGDLVPDPNARVPYYSYSKPRQASWPEADFIVGNPPYMGGTRMREAFGDGYVDALRAVYPMMPEGSDFVMYWWMRAADQVALGTTIRAGLITTNSITQPRNRAVVEMMADRGAKVLWAISDHPWIDENGGAAVRVAMTISGQGGSFSTLAVVDERANVVRELTVPTLNADLSVSADVASAVQQPLAANQGISFLGFLVNGPGFIISHDEAQRLLEVDPNHSDVLKPYISGRDVADRPRFNYVIDFGLRTVEEARGYPVLYNLVVDRVKPIRDANRDRGIRENWWRFHRVRHELRIGMEGLNHLIITPETTKHRYFTILDQSTSPDHSLICITSADLFYLGALSSSIHITWSLAAGGRLGIGNDPRYNKGRCFDPFPFPDPPQDLREEIGRVAERLDQHRKDTIARDERVTMTGMYNVVEKLRSGEKLTDKERAIHEIAACGVLKDVHDELDRLVAQAYGWPWPMEREEVLERLVALHDERVEEEKRGIIRWLRPEYQIPRFGGAAAAMPEPALELPPEQAVAAPAVEEARPWPAGVIEQIGAVKARVTGSPATPAEVAAAFAGAPTALVGTQLQMLTGTGEVRLLPDGRYEAVAEPL